MIKIREVDYTDICSCCESRTKIIIELDSLLSAIDFCESCWKEFEDKINEYNSNQIKASKVCNKPTLEDIVGSTFIFQQDEWDVLEFIGCNGEYRCINKRTGIIKYFPMYKTYDMVLEYKTN